MRYMRTSLALLIIFTLITGIIYPLFITGIAQLLFPFQANGSVILKNGSPAGSVLIGQKFTGDKYFWGRPSATAPHPYNSAASSGSNLGGANPAFIQTVKERAALLRKSNPSNTRPIPVDLVTSSASGLDPHISPAAALYQAQRVAKARNMEETNIHALIAANTEKQTFGILGETRVNVLKLNMALDDLN